MEHDAEVGCKEAFTSPTSSADLDADMLAAHNKTCFPDDKSNNMYKIPQFEQDLSSDEGGPSSSIEANADPNDFDIGEMEDIDMQMPVSLFGPVNDPSPTSDEKMNTDLGYFDFLTSNENNSLEAGDVKSDKAIAGVCGFRNIGNTCYMNSGLQCLLATPPVVEFFLQFFNGSSQGSKEQQEKDMEEKISSAFGPLLNDVWQGSFEIMKPTYFKEALGLRNAQFIGSHQHDCQEFLAILLDALHEELRISHGNFKVLNRSDGGTSMELHTSHSKDSGMPFYLSANIEESKSLKNSSGSIQSKVNSRECNRDAPTCTDLAAELDSGESASPKSFDSLYSNEEKIPSSIRNMPIPPNVKSFTSADGDEGENSRLSYNDDDTMDSTNSSNSNNPTSNLVTTDSLIKTQKSNTNHCDQNNQPGISEDEVKVTDYIKDTKTLNVNVLAEEENVQMNNELNFDSGKFSKHHENSRPRETIDNLNMAMNNELEKKNPKRFKSTNLQHGDQLVGKDKTDILEFGDMKRIRLDSHDKEKNVQLEMERQQGLPKHSDKTPCADDIEDEENLELLGGDPILDEVDEVSLDGASALPATYPQDTRYLKEAIEADRYWEKYLAANDTVVARSFQGLFKNTVVCSVCQYPSVTFEPFMYLPVPLPDAVVRQVEVTLITARPSLPPTTYLLDLNQADNVETLKKKLIEVADLQDLKLELQAVEVTDCRVSRMLEDWTLLRHLHHKSLSAIEVFEETVQEEEVQDQDPLDVSAKSNLYQVASSSQMEAMETVQSFEKGIPHLVTDCTTVSTDVETEYLDTGVIIEPKEEADHVVPSIVQDKDPLSPTKPTSRAVDPSCVICMEDFAPRDLMQHNACDCIMCQPCVQRTLDHHISDDEIPKGHFKCPGCRENVDPSVEFVGLHQIGSSKPKLRYFTIPVVLRLITTSGQMRLIGQPFLLKLPNQISGSRLFQILDPIIRLECNLGLFLVNSQGKNCSRCLYSERCTGCIRIRRTDDMVLLQSSDTIALSYCNVDEDYLNVLYQPQLHSSMNNPRVKEKLSLKECLDAFSEEETLDQNNPWYCPTCRKNQCATKKLTVWKFPDYLIIYLKRFIYINGVSVKLEKPVEFELCDFDLTPFMSGPLRADVQTKFDLYACVNHFGTVGGGHYTAFCKHSPSERWNYFDDSNVVKEKAPGNNLKSDMKSVYVLFFQRKGTSDQYRLPSPSSGLMSSDCLNTDGRVAESKLINSEDLSSPSLEITTQAKTARCLS